MSAKTEAPTLSLAFSGGRWDRAAAGALPPPRSTGPNARTRVRWRVRLSPSRLVFISLLLLFGGFVCNSSSLLEPQISPFRCCRERKPSCELPLGHGLRVAPRCVPIIPEPFHTLQCDSARDACIVCARRGGPALEDVPVPVPSTSRRPKNTLGVQALALAETCVPARFVCSGNVPCSPGGPAVLASG